MQKAQKLFMILFLMLTVFSCTETVTIRKTIKIGDLKISWFRQISGQTTFGVVEAYKKSSSKIILKCNEGRITDIYQLKDTIMIKMYNPPSRENFYKFEDKISNYYIKIDSTATIDDWSKAYEKVY